MATPTRSREQQAAQRGLILVMLRELTRTWPVLDARRLGATVPQWIAAVLAVVTRFGEMSGTLALDYYDEERDVAGVRGAGPAPDLRIPPAEQVDRSLRWATKNLWSEDVRDAAADVDRLFEEIAQAEAAVDLSRFDEDAFADLGEDDLAEEELPLPGDADAVVEQVRVTRAKVEGITSKLVADVGRGAVVDAVAADRSAVGCARLAAPDACAFCRVMSIRGLVYKDERTAGRRANTRFVGAGEFKYHDHCKCVAAPYFEGEEWQPQPQIELWERQYQQARSMRGDTLANFNRIIRAQT